MFNPLNGDSLEKYSNLIVPQLSTHLQMLIHVRGVSHEAALCSFGHLHYHVFCDRWEQQPVHAVEAEGQPQHIQEITQDGPSKRSADLCDLVHKDKHHLETQVAIRGALILSIHSIQI